VTNPTTNHSPCSEFRRLWQRGGLSWVSLVWKTTTEFRKNELDSRSAQFAYYALLAMAPLLIVMIACVAMLPIEGLLDDFQKSVDVGMPENVVQLIKEQIRDIQDRTSTALITGGCIVFFLAGSRLFMTIGAGLDKVFAVENRRRYWRARLLGLLMTAIVFVLLLVTMALQLIGPWFKDFFQQYVDIVWLNILLSSGVRWGIASGFMLVSTSMLYWIVPNQKMRWHWLSPGSVVATVGWVAVTIGYQLYVEQFSRYNETYGALGGVIVLMIWLYLTGALILFGGQMNAVIHRQVQSEN